MGIVPASTDRIEPAIRLRPPPKPHPLRGARAMERTAARISGGSSPKQCRKEGEVWARNPGWQSKIDRRPIIPPPCRCAACGGRVGLPRRPPGRPGPQPAPPALWRGSGRCRSGSGPGGGWGRSGGSLGGTGSPGPGEGRQIGKFPLSRDTKSDPRLARICPYKSMV